MCDGFCKKRGESCKLIKWLAGAPMMIGIVFLLFGMVSLIFPYIISIFTSELPNDYISHGSFMIFPTYDSLINFMTAGVMLFVFGLVAGIVIMGVVEPFLRFLKTN